MLEGIRKLKDLAEIEFADIVEDVFITDVNQLRIILKDSRTPGGQIFIIDKSLKGQRDVPFPKYFLCWRVLISNRDCFLCQSKK